MKLSSVETELKLALSPSVAESVLSVPALTRNRAGRPKARRLVTTYYETPEKDLARRGVTLRIRQADDERIQTLKSVGGSGVVNSRGEWEWPVKGATPDLELVKKAPISDLLADVSEDRLEPVVVTDVVRTTQALEVDGDIVEAALDQGSIVAGEAKEDVRELELELREGTPASLYRLALELNSAVPFDIEVESKAARGFRLMDRLPPRASKPSATRLSPDDSAIQGLRAIVEETLGHLLANQPAALAGDPEGVHQVRIAVRRIRSALRLFSPHIEPHAMRLFEDGASPRRPDDRGGPRLGRLLRRDPAAGLRNCGGSKIRRNDADARRGAPRRSARELRATIARPVLPGSGAGTRRLDRGGAREQRPGRR
jgi:triphosphatase